MRRIHCEQELARARELFCGTLPTNRSNLLTWRRVPLWIDRERWIALPRSEAQYRGIADAAVAPPDKDVFASLEMFGGPRRGVNTSDLLCAVARLNDAAPKRPLDSIPDVHLFNLAVIQPLVNPAFGSLWWLLLAEANDSRAWWGNLDGELSPLAFDMSDWPASRAEARAVRLAQILWVERFAPGTAGADAETVSEEAWAATCAALLERRALWVERVVIDAAGTVAP